MNGNKILLDTNAIIYALNYGLRLPSYKYLVSFITEIELLSYNKLTKEDILKIKSLLNYFQIVDIDKRIKEKTIYIRKNYGIKLPDSLICATSIEYNAMLVSNDKQLKKIKELQVLSLESFSS